MNRRIGGGVRTSLLLLFALAGACAAPGPYPSLAVREAELQRDAEDVEAAQAPALPDNPEIAAQVRSLLAEGRTGHDAFEAAFGPARAAAARAGAPGSDSWVEAQQAISRIEAARAPTLHALAELDALTIREAGAGRLGAGDRDRLAAAMAELQALADRQHDRIEALRSSLRGG
jgi:hypothetical protein